MNSGIAKLALFIGLSAVGHGLVLYPWSGPSTMPLVSSSDGSYAVAIVAKPETTTNTQERAEPRKLEKLSPQTATNKPDTSSSQKPALDRERIIAEINTSFTNHFYYPPQAERFGIEGLVMLGFEVRGNGSIHNIKVLRSSGSHILDHAAVDALQKMGDLQQLQSQLHGQSLVIELPVRYQQ